MKINSIEAACESLGIDLAAIRPDLSQMPEWLQISTQANIDLDIIAEAMREGKTLGPGDGWYPVFDEDDTTEPSGFGFSFSFAYYWITHTVVGARRKLLTEEDSDHFGTHFIELHRASKMLSISKEVKGE